MMTKQEIENELNERPDIARTINAAATLTPEDLDKVIDFAKQRNESRKTKNETL